MSAHDPFDGIYDDGEAAESSTATSPAQQQVVSADEGLTRGRLETMRKAELQAVAREYDLDDSGTRDDLIERIEAVRGGNA